MNNKKRILVAPLNWGLGHATRCIPIINALIENDFEPIIASDGKPLKLLKKEFSDIISLTLPSYEITYSKKASNFKYKILKDSPSILKAIKKEKKKIEKIIENYSISGIISDNRFGVRNKKVPSVFITHQLNVLSGSTSWLSSKLHQKQIAKFDECWVPDFFDEPNLSGKLGHIKTEKLNIKYVGPLSRFQKKDSDIKYNLMVLLSGPEPQRTFLDTLLMDKLKGYNGNVIFVKGQIEEQQISTNKTHITIYNYMTSQELETVINQSELVLSRSGYTTIMDLAKLEKKAFFIPTPGQYEQEYLAKILAKKGLVPYCKQDDFTLGELDKVKTHSGLSSREYQTDFKALFNLFKGE